MNPVISYPIVGLTTLLAINHQILKFLTAIGGFGQ